jgi:hypothetical protein
MVIALIGIDPYDSRLLEQVPVDVSPSNLACPSELDPDKLSESRRVVVPHCLGVSESFEYGIGAQDLFRQIGKVASSRFCAWVVRVGNCSQVLDDFLGVLSLTGARFSAVAFVSAELW